MGHMPPNCFSNTENRNAKSKCDIEGGTWLQAMGPYFDEEVKATYKIIQINIVEAHTPYLKGHHKKHVMNKWKKRLMLSI